MIRSKARFAVALALSAAALPALADTLKLVSTGATVVDGAYIYPYNFSIDGSSALTSLICIDYNREVTLGEQWNVNETAIPTDDSTSSQDLRALALLDYGLVKHVGGYSASDYQFADWSILDSSAVDQLSGYTPTAALLASDALQLADITQLTNSGFYSQFTLYAADLNDTTGWTAGRPQDFVGLSDPTSVTPEPSSLLFLGTGLAGVWEAARRKRSDKTAQ